MYTFKMKIQFLVAKLGKENLSFELGVSISTINRWLNGGTYSQMANSFVDMVFKCNGGF